MKTVFELQLPDVLSFVKQSCHENLHDNLVALRDLADEKDMDLIPAQLSPFVKDFIRRIQYHLTMEENDLFPMIEKQMRESNVFPIHNLLEDHDEFGSDLEKLRVLTKNYTLLPEFNPKAVRFYKMLLELERIIQNHIQIENNVLYPMVLKIS
jgi:regulator of cell morphogenesis and NO signaling